MTTPSDATTRESSVWLNVWQFSGLVTRRDYISAGLVLMPLKYLVEAAVIYFLADKFYSPLDFINPLLSGRQYFTADAPAWLGMAWVVWTVPFVWIGLAMSVRRSLDIGISPWLGLLIVVPVVNWLALIAWSVLPSQMIARNSSEPKNERELEEAQAARDLASIYRPTMSDPGDEPPMPDDSGFGSSVLGIVAGVGFSLTCVILSVYGLGGYGASLFFGAPIVTGAMAAYLRNRPVPVSVTTTLAHSSFTMIAACCVFLIVGLEGIICIAMAIPIMLPLGLIGAVVGRTIAVAQFNSDHPSYRGLYGCLVALPILAAVEKSFQPTPIFEVSSSMEIAAPIDVVWDRVIEFPEIDSSPEWYFRMGIAYPQRARIEGHGVGAVRHCEFTTGAFVEPITAWEKPTRLAFDVTDQPEPMFELTPYRHIHPPHLDGAFRSLRGEFRLRALSPNKTLLEGSTWYTLDIRPHSYWTNWTDWIIHRIHIRVLNHIRRVAEA